MCWLCLWQLPWHWEPSRCVVWAVTGSYPDTKNQVSVLCGLWRAATQTLRTKSVCCVGCAGQLPWHWEPSRCVAWAVQGSYPDIENQVGVLCGLCRAATLTLRTKSVCCVGCDGQLPRHWEPSQCVVWAVCRAATQTLRPKLILIWSMLVKKLWQLWMEQLISRVMSLAMIRGCVIYFCGIQSINIRLIIKLSDRSLDRPRHTTYNSRQNN